MRARNRFLHGLFGGAPLVALWACALPGEAQAPPPLPEGWVVPSAAQLDGPDRASRERDPERYLEVVADFDGDGDSDVARLLVDRTGKEYALFISTPTNGNFAHHKLTGGPVAEIDSTGISEVEPGRYATACGKGFGSGPCEAEEVSLTHAGVDLFAFESAAQYVFWDGSRFKVVGISD